jgi:hypothetical protein
MTSWSDVNTECTEEVLDADCRCWLMDRFLGFADSTRRASPPP